MGNKGYVRNMPCPCGSDKKYKKCCMHKQSSISDGLSESEIKQIADTIQQECIAKYGGNEKAAEQFWKELITTVYKKDPSVIPVMIKAQPDPANKQYMQKIYRELTCSSN